MPLDGDFQLLTAHAQYERAEPHPQSCKTVDRSIVARAYHSGSIRP